jgi:hypothetical protein
MVTAKTINAAAPDGVTGTGALQNYNSGRSGKTVPKTHTINSKE